MCGVGAVFSNTPISKMEAILDSVNVSLAHRGPDGHGMWVSNNKKVGLSHTRLSIIDLTDASAQPLLSADGRFTLSFNGEIYNYKELREECVALGSVFKSSGDSEVIIEMYRHFGEAISNRLRGMWAIVLIDNHENKAFISRDPFGIKPLFFGQKNGILMLASEIKAFHKVDESFLEVDSLSVELFKTYRFYDRGNWTFFKNIKKFPLSHHITFDLNKIPELSDFKPQLYWTGLNFEKTSSSEKEQVKKLHDLFEESIKIHMRSDVPVGFCLSGGIDSSSIVSTARKLFPQAELTTFTTRFDKYERIDETAWAKLVIEDAEANAIFVSPSASDFVKDLPHLIESQDEPFGSASIYSQYCIFRAIHKAGVKVVLDGQGADEVFAGYHSFFPYYVFSLIKEGKFIQAIRISRLLKKNYNYDFSVYQKIGAKIRDYARNMLRGFSLSRAKSDEPVLTHLFYKKCDKEDTLNARVDFCRRTPSNFEEFLTFMVFEGNVPMLLRFEDRNSMAFSVESRVPFLINELVEFSLKIPSELKMKKGITKYVLRESMRGTVPDKVLNRMDKLGFPAPDKEWMKELYGQDVGQPFSDQWIELMLKAWNEMLTKRKTQTQNLFSGEKSELNFIGC